MAFIQMIFKTKLWIGAIVGGAFYLRYHYVTKGPEATGSLLLLVVSGSKFCADL